MPFLLRSVVCLTIGLLPHCLFGQIDSLQALSAVNSPYDEQAPLLDPKEQALYFTVAKHPQNAGGITDTGDIWVSTPDSTGNWGVPQRVVSLNNQDYNAVMGVSPSGDTLYLHGWYTGGESVYMKGVSYSVRTDSGWATPKRLTVKYFKNVAPHQSGTLSPDGKVMILSLEAFSGRGAEDLYVAYRQLDGSYTGLKNLGDDLNTELQEMTPYLAPDGITLYFASNRNQGTGRDLYLSQRLDDTYRSWSSPEPLDTTINSPGIELYLAIDAQQEWAYFTSNQNSEGYGDFYRFRLPQPVKDTIQSIDTTQADSLSPLDSAVVDSVLLANSDSLQEDTLGDDLALLTPSDSITSDSLLITDSDSVTTDTLLLVQEDAPTLGVAQLWLEVLGVGDTLLRSAKVEAHRADTVWLGEWIGDTLQVSYPDSLVEFELRVSAPRYFSQERVFNAQDSLVSYTITLEPIAVGATVKLES
ncbi:MAG: hypothetical protein AAFQ98_17905, partial [Bacteroidota bacterium]